VFSVLQLLDTFDRPAYFSRNVKYEHFNAYFVLRILFSPLSMSLSVRRWWSFDANGHISI